jgi:hypothetical protein
MPRRGEDLEPDGPLSIADIVAGDIGFRGFIQFHSPFLIII